MATLATLFRKEFELCNVQKGETIAIVSDLNSRRDYVAGAFAAASDLGAGIYEMCVNAWPSWTRMGVETIGHNKGTLEALCKADMIVMFHIPLFTKWLKVVRDAGARVLLVIDAPQMLDKLLSPPDLKPATVHAGNRLGSAKEMRVISDAGALQSRRGVTIAGAEALFTRSQTKARQTGRWSFSLATSSSCHTAATSKTKFGWRCVTASSARSKVASMPS
jgi:hypothetical protein